METISEEANRRLEAPKFWDKHGMETTQDFYKMSRRTLFRWKRLYKTSGRTPVSLTNQSRAPTRRRVRLWPAAVLARLRELRQNHPSLGAGKLQIFLADWCDTRNLSRFDGVVTAIARRNIRTWWRCMNVAVRRGLAQK